MKTPEQAAYETWSEQTGGHALPWDNLPEDWGLKWRRIAEAVIRQHQENERAHGSTFVDPLGLAGRVESS